MHIFERIFDLVVICSHSIRRSFRPFFLHSVARLRQSVNWKKKIAIKIIILRLNDFSEHEKKSQNGRV